MYIHELAGERLHGDDETDSIGMDYLAETESTASNVFRCDHVGSNELAQALFYFILASQKLDLFKKAMFRQRSRLEAKLPETFDGPSLDDLITGMGHEDLFHGIIGVCTEAGEMAEILQKLLSGQKVDITNVKEEMGDVLWYLARTMKWADTTFLTEMKRNIAKLRQRHGEAGFNRDADIERNLEAERKTLEG